MKQNQFSIGEKHIQTPSLLIKKNIMTWDNTLIQLSNISYISADNIATTSFPILAGAMLVFGLFLLGELAVLGLSLILFGASWIFLWNKDNAKRKKGAILTIRMNSGHTLYFAFENKKFLIHVLEVLERIIIDGGTHNSQVSINVKDCKIDNSRLFSDINM